MFYRLWKFIKSLFNKLFDRPVDGLEILIEEAKEVVVDCISKPFGNVVNWSDEFIDQCTSSDGITWPKSNDGNVQFEELIRRQNALIKRNKIRPPLKLIISKQLAKYLERARSFVYDTTDYITNKIIKFSSRFKTKALTSSNSQVPTHNRFYENDNSYYDSYKELDNFGWYKCVNFIESFDNTYINLNKSYYFPNRFATVFKYGDTYSTHYKNLHLNKEKNIIIKCNNFDKFEHFILFLRYEINIAINTKSKNVIAAIDDEYQKSRKNKFPFFKSKNTFKNKFRKYLINDYNLYFDSSVADELHELPLSMFFEQAINKKEVLTYKMFNLFKSLGDDQILNQLNVNYNLIDDDSFRLIENIDDRRVSINFGV